MGSLLRYRDIVQLADVDDLVIVIDGTRVTCAECGGKTRSYHAGLVKGKKFCIYCAPQVMFRMVWEKALATDE